MRARQLWFWPPPRPLVERFGAQFFRQVPAAPAVYLFCGPGEGVLYVGKAKNLCRRLAAYRVANPERLPRRLIRCLRPDGDIYYLRHAPDPTAKPVVLLHCPVF